MKRPSSFPSRQRKTIWLASTHQMPSSGSTSAGRRLLDVPRLRRNRPCLDGARDEREHEVLDRGLARVGQNRRADLVLGRDQHARDEAGHRAAVSGEDPLTVTPQPEAEPVAAGPANVVVDRLHRPHLLDGRLREHRLVRLGEESGPAAEVAHRTPHLTGRDPAAGLDGGLDDGALDVLLHEVAGGRRRLGLEADPTEPERIEQPRPHVVRVRHPGGPLDDDSEQREREVGVVEARAGRQYLLRIAERLDELLRRREAQREPRVVLRLPLDPRRVREQPPQRRPVRRAVDVTVERVL